MRASARPWLVLVVALMAALAALDLAVDFPEALAPLVVPTLIAAVRLGPRPTALVATGGALLTFLDDTVEGAFDGEPERLLETAVVAAAGGLAVWLAQTRERASAAELESASSLALVDALFEGAPIGLGFWDTELRFRRLNRALAAINGLPVEAHLGRRLTEVLPDLDPGVVEGFRDVVRTGEPIVEVEVGGETPAAPGERRTWLASYYPVRQGEEIVGLGATVLDITERKRVERMLAGLAEIVDAALAPVGLEELLRGLLERLGRVFEADAAAILLLEPDRRTLAHRTSWGLSAEGAESVRIPVGEGFTGRLASERRVIVLNDPTPADFADPILRRQGLATLIGAPLLVRGRPIGVVHVGRLARRRFEPHEERLLRLAADRMAVAIEHARLSEQEREVAAILQRGLLPERLPEIPGLEAASRYRAAGEAVEVGGDFYDLFEVDDGRWVALIGDITGKGPRAASLTALVRHTARAAALAHSEPVSVLARVNDALRRLDRRELCSVAVVRLDLRGDAATATIASAGHPLPLLLRPGGDVRAVGGHGAVIGAADRLPLRQAAVELAPGDALALYTDGLTDAWEPDRTIGLTEIGEALRSAPSPTATSLAGALERLVIDEGGALPRDDVAILVIRRRAAAARPVGGERWAA